MKTGPATSRSCSSTCTRFRFEHIVIRPYWDDLCELLKSLKIGVKVKMVEEVEIDETVFASI